MIKYKSTAQFFGVVAAINVAFILFNPSYAAFHVTVALIATALALTFRRHPPKHEIPVVAPVKGND